MTLTHLVRMTVLVSAFALGALFAVGCSFDETPDQASPNYANVVHDRIIGDCWSRIYDGIGLDGGGGEWKTAVGHHCANAVANRLEPPPDVYVPGWGRGYWLSKVMWLLHGIHPRNYDISREEDYVIILKQSWWIYATFAEEGVGYNVDEFNDEQVRGWYIVHQDDFWREVERRFGAPSDDFQREVDRSFGVPPAE